MQLALVRHWWLLAMRGILALAFGTAAFFWPDIGLGRFVLLFGAWAFFDGAIALGSAFGSAERLTQGWPLLLEGMISMTLGTLAWVWPRLSLHALYAIATWGLISGALQLGGAMVFRLDLTSRALLALGGASSLLLAGFLMALPHAGGSEVVRAFGFYAVVFGALVFAASLRLRHRGASLHRSGLVAGAVSGMLD